MPNRPSAVTDKPKLAVTKTLVLMRHAKADAASPGGRDAERALAPRGERAAIMAGKTLLERGLRPELVLCSTAQRTRETLDGLRGGLPMQATVQFEDQLYLASSEDILELIQAMPDTVASALVIGHNPGLHDCALALTSSSVSSRDLATLQGRFPTAGLAVLTFKVSQWAEVGEKSGRLEYFDLSARLG